MAGGAILWPNSQPIQVVPSEVKFRTDPSGATCRLRDYSSYGLNIWVRCASGNVFGQVMSPHHSDQMSQESQVSLVSL